MSIEDLQNLDGLDKIKFVNDDGANLDQVQNIYCILQKGKMMRGRSGHLNKSDDITRAEFGAHSIEYIKKRSGLLALEEGKNKIKKNKKRKKCVSMNENNNYTDKSDSPKVTKEPSYITLTDYTTQKHIDFKTIASKLLG
eukprot:12648730-Ditylum_brightwellii.AAC.1